MLQLAINDAFKELAFKFINDAFFKINKLVSKCKKSTITHKSYKK
jgi:hypothetical protein